MPVPSETDEAGDAAGSMESSARRAVSEPAPRMNLSSEAPDAPDDDDGTRVFHFGA